MLAQASAHTLPGSGHVRKRVTISSVTACFGLSFFMVISTPIQSASTIAGCTANTSRQYATHEGRGAASVPFASQRISRCISIRYMPVPIASLIACRVFRVDLGQVYRWIERKRVDGVAAECPAARLGKCFCGDNRGIARILEPAKNLMTTALWTGELNTLSAIY